ELFLLCTCMCFVGYAVADAFVFWASAPSDAWFAEVLGVSALTLSTAFFVLFAAALYGRPARDLFLVFAPSAALIALGPILLAAPPVPGGPGAPAFLPAYNPLGFAFWAAYVDVYGLTGVVPLYRTYREVRGQVRVSARRAFGFVLAAAIGMAMWFAWNATVVLFHLDAPPLFSTLLVLPGLVALVASLPSGHGTFLAGIRRARGVPYGVQAAFLVHKGGLLIDSTDVWQEVGVDADLFGATLDTIQNFMQTSFPALGGPGLRSVAFGNRTLLIERGRYAYLIVVLAGQEDEALRWTLRDLLREFESKNADVLKDWMGGPEDVTGAKELLAALVAMG
ncbi:MAG TPA: hypothetical protein VEY12_07930, partial [Thermoplasmata archaeon]|nr:hypothetical protein [Thermoplasmata archaeon]